MKHSGAKPPRRSRRTKGKKVDRLEDKKEISGPKVESSPVHRQVEPAAAPEKIAPEQLRRQLIEDEFAYWQSVVIKAQGQFTPDVVLAAAVLAAVALMSPVKPS